MNKIINNLEDKFQDFISEKRLINPGEKILLAVSGGLDSSVMTHLFSKTDYEFGIAHCNFSLRGEESDADAEFAESLADKYQKPFYLKVFDTLEFADENKYSIQEAARILRYKWFYDLCFEFNYQKIATAHHLDDSIETFFINLLRGTGTAGLRGIPVINDKVIRPMLFTRRAEIEQYALQNKIHFHEDSSNQTDDYLRNRIRHHVLPVIKENAEGFEENMSKLMDDFSYIHRIVADRIHSWKQEYAQTDHDGNIFLPLKEILADDNPASFLSAILFSYRIKIVDCDKIIAVETPGKIFYAGKNSILRDREFLIIRKSEENEIQSYKIDSLPAEISTKNLKVAIHTEELEENISSVVNKHKFQIDGAKITLPLILRTWKPGDYFFPLGMKGKKKISDFYSDEKINRFEKDKIYLLLSGTDIVCILGHRIDDRFKITPSTRKILTIEIKST